ncbi:MAG: hypothetical protein P8Y74_11805 [Desulfobacterales bacterium]
MKKLSTISLLIGVAAVLACAYPGDTTPSSPSHFEVAIPAGWQKHTTKKFFLIYKVDPLRQYILAQERPLDKPFKFSKKRLTAGMQSQEVATVVIDELKSDKQLLNLVVIESASATIKGNDGCRILFTYGLGDGSHYKTLYYGFIRDASYVSLRLNVAADKDFDRDLQAFNEVVDSIRFLVAGPV